MGHHKFKTDTSENDRVDVNFTDAHCKHTRSSIPRRNSKKYIAVPPCLKRQEPNFICVNGKSVLCEYLKEYDVWTSTLKDLRVQAELGFATTVVCDATRTEARLLVAIESHVSTKCIIAQAEFIDSEHGFDMYINNKRVKLG